jgi:hypothetical protein
VDRLLIYNDSSHVEGELAGQEKSVGVSSHRFNFDSRA